MIIDFQAASKEFALHPLVREIVNKKYRQLQLQPETKDILVHLPEAYFGKDAWARNKVEEILKLEALITRYGPDIFYYRQNRVPSSAYYAILGETQTPQLAGLYKKLPADFMDVSRDILELMGNPELMNSPHISPVAKFCHKIKNLAQLEIYLDDIRSKALEIDSEEMVRLYDEYVRKAHYSLLHEDALTDKIIDTIQKINYIYNHHDGDYGFHIRLAMEQGEDVFNKELIFHTFNLPEDSLEHFKTAYKFFEDLHGGPGYNAFYDVYEKIIMPFQLFNGAETADTLTTNYLIASSVMCHGYNSHETAKLFGPEAEEIHFMILKGSIDGNLLDRHGISLQKFNSIKGCIAISDLIFSHLKLWGERLHPLYQPQEMHEFQELLKDTEDLIIDHPVLKNEWRKARYNAIKDLNFCIEMDKDLAAELAPYVPPQP